MKSLFSTARRLVWEEDGMTMGLAIITVALIGVMGAGLLVFVQRDLETVVRTNQSQEAFEMADAGVRLAKRELLSNACPQSYDNNTAVGADGCEESNWSYYEDSSEDAGKDLSFDGEDINVEIRHLKKSSDASETSQEGFAPVINENDDREFFKIDVTGEGGSGEAVRRVEAIVHTYDLGVPKAYYTPGKIKVAGNACIDSVSLFSSSTAADAIKFAGGGSGCPGGGKIEGPDLAYDDWENSFNATTRSGSSCTATQPDGTVITKMCAGAAALGGISGSSQLGTRDYDSTTNPQFVANPNVPQGPDQITFPFDYQAQEGAQDQARIDFLREEARRNGVYYPSNGGQVNVGSDVTWPTDATDQTVVFVDYLAAGGNNRVDWEVGNDSDPAVKGTLVVSGGNFRTTQHKACFEGVVIVRGGTYEDGTSTDAGGNTCLNGFVNASGEIEIKGGVEPMVSDEVINRPGFYGISRWSWREVYSLN